jgi:hypothetical protein
VVRPKREAEEAGGQQRADDGAAAASGTPASVGSMIDTMPAAGRKMM